MLLWILYTSWIIIPFHSVGLLHRCPSEKNITTNCSCVKNKDVYVTCTGITTTQYYYKAIQSFRGYVIDNINIEKTGTLELFSGSFKKLYICNVTFSTVSFGTLPVLTFLDGLEESLETLNFIDCSVKQWLWEKGSHFNLLQFVRFERTSLPGVITKTMMSALPRKIRHLKMINCKILAFGTNALRRFSLLENLELNGNSFSTIQRSTLPLPARRLKYISMANCSLYTLPKNIFVQMRRLEFLSLSHTELTVLHQEVFEPVWEQLEEIYFNDIILRCSCESAWLLNQTTGKIFRPPQCKSEGRGRKRLLTEFSYKDLCF